jgi:hypothetical protein
MPINKADGAYLRKTGISYEIVPRATVDSISGCEALSLWIYLITRPQNWVVRRADIKKRFTWGRDKYTRAMNELKEIGLVTVAQVRGEDGQLQGNIIWVNHQSTEVQVNGTSVKPAFRLNSTHKDTDKNIKETESSATLFNAFWELYPNKKDKKKAQVSFKRLSNVKKDLAMKHIKSNPFNGTDKKYIPLPTTYINGERWEDEDVAVSSSSIGGWE